MITELEGGYFEAEPELEQTTFLKKGSMSVSVTVLVFFIKLFITDIKIFCLFSGSKSKTEAFLYFSKIICPVRLISPEGVGYGIPQPVGTVFV